MKLYNTFVLRFATALIMLMHSLPSFITLDVVDFGKGYLSSQGFGSFGLPLALLIKTIQLLSAPALVLNRYIKLVSILNIIILTTGIFMIHLQEGWYVVGGGRNGVEFNVLLISVFMNFLLPEGIASLRFKKT